MENSKDGTPVRQNSQYTPSRKHEANLRRNPTLHFQIGLILALLVSIFFIELRTSDTAEFTPKEEIPIEEVYTIGEVQPEKKVIKKVKKIVSSKPKAPVIIDKAPKPTEKEVVETLIDPTDPTETTMPEPTDVPYEDPVEEIAPTIFSLVETVPLFPGCEGLSNNTERRDCMSEKISKFVAKKFRSEQGEGLGLSGVNRIYVTFKIDKVGKVVDVQAKAPHPRLEKEAKRVTELLPDMTAGRQAGKDVEVLFSLPISFQIRD